MPPSKRLPARERLRVLIVDDDALLRELLRAVLQDGGFIIDEASDGETALRLATADPPDVVVLDVMMPGMNGFEVCRALRADPATDGAHVIMLTARDAPSDRDEGQAAGADVFFTKPFSPLDLLEAVSGVRDGVA